MLLDEIAYEIPILSTLPVPCSHGFSNKFPLSVYEKMVRVGSDSIGVRDLPILIEKNGQEQLFPLHISFYKCLFFLNVDSHNNKAPVFKFSIQFYQRRQLLLTPGSPGRPEI